MKSIACSFDDRDMQLCARNVLSFQFGLEKLVIPSQSSTFGITTCFSLVCLGSASQLEK